MSNITDNDKYVLNAIFNPSYPLDFDKETATDTVEKQNESKIRFTVSLSFSVSIYSLSID